MSDSSPSVKSLYNLSLCELSNSMKEEMLQYVLKCYPPAITLPIIWNILYIDKQSLEHEDFNHLNGMFSKSFARGQKLTELPREYTLDTLKLPYTTLNISNHSEFAESQQTKFTDKCNFFNHFNLDLFFKLVEYTECRSQLFIIFQICVQIKGLNFPKKFAQKWINKEIKNNDEHFHLIEQGLKLGIFLGDTGWFNESALVLSHTYNIISTKWICLDKHLVLIKTIQCLTKWLLVTSNFYNFNEAKIVLQNMLYTIDKIEQLEGRKLCIAYAYVAVSQYYYQLMEFKQAYSWTVKAINELHNKSGAVLKLLVISHAIKVCSALNKLNIANKLKDQINKYKHDHEIELHISIDMLLNEACYMLRADLANDSISYYYIALDTKRNLFGYFNLHTASVFVDYAYARYVCDYATNDFSVAMHSVLQGIYIMKEIGLPKDHMMLVNAGRIKALILEETALDIVERIFDVQIQERYQSLGEEALKRLLDRMKQTMLTEAECLQKEALACSLKAVGEKSLLAAKHYCNLGRLYQSKEDYVLSEKMHLKAIEVKESVLGKDDPEVALSLGHLASLYTYQLKNYKEAEKLYLRSKSIYETTFGSQYTGLLYDLRGLAQVYFDLNDMIKYNECSDSIHRFRHRREAWLLEVHASEHEEYSTDVFNLETIKRLIND